MTSLRTSLPPHALNQVLGARIREVRSLRRMSQRQLCARISLGISMLSRYESGHHSPTVRSLYRIAQELEVPVDCLLPEIAFEATSDRDLHRFFRQLWFFPPESRALLATLLNLLFTTLNRSDSPWGRFAGERHDAPSGR